MIVDGQVGRRCGAGRSRHEHRGGGEVRREQEVWGGGKVEGQIGVVQGGGVGDGRGEETWG